MDKRMKLDSTSIGYLGPAGTFSHQAGLKYQPDSANPCILKAYPTIPHILYAVEKGEIDLGIVPAENSIEGSVNITMDLLAHELSLFIQKEIILEITHCLFSYMKELKQIHTVMSHPQALAQCRHFLYKEMSGVKLLETQSTSEAVQRLTLGGNGLAAIASSNNQSQYDVPILAHDIGDYSHNQTRFLLVGKEPCQHEKTSKTSLVLAFEKDRPGALYEILGEFAKQQINLSKIESRPAKKELGNYIFLIDCEAGADNPALQQVLSILKTKTGLLKNLGSY